MSNFLQLIIYTLVEVFNQIVGPIVVGICKMIMSEDYSPNLDTFYTYMSEYNIAKLLGFSKTLGYTIIILIFTLSMSSVLFGFIRETKDKPITLLLRCFMALMTINLLVIPDVGNHTDNGFINGILSTGEEIFYIAESKLGTDASDADDLLSEEESWSSSKLKYSDSILDDLLSGEILGDFDVNFFELLTGLPSISGIIKTIITGVIKLGLIIAMATTVIELAYDMIRRYVNFCGLYICMPAACGLIAGFSTLDVFFKYITMFICEIFMMSFCRIWLAATLYLMGTTYSSIYGLIFVTAWAQFGRNIDKLLNKIGLSTASTGGSLVLASMAAGAGIIGAEVGAASKGTGFVGALTGNDKLSTLSQVLSKNPTGAGSTARMQQTDESVASKMGQAFRSYTNPSGSGLSKDQEARMRADLNSPNMRNMGHFQDMYGRMNDQQKAAFNKSFDANNSELKDRLGSDLGFETTDIGKNGAKLDLYDRSAKFDEHGNVMKDENGDILRKNEKVGEGRIANEKDDKAVKSVPYTDNDGHQKWANFYSDKNTQPKAGDRATFKSEDLIRNKEDGKPFNTPDEARCNYDLNNIVDFDPSKGDVTRIKTDEGCRFYQGDESTGGRKLIGEQIGNTMHSKGRIFSDSCLDKRSDYSTLSSDEKMALKKEMFENQFYKAGETNSFGNVVTQDGAYADKFGGLKPENIEFKSDSITATFMDRNEKNATEQKYTWHSFDQDNPATKHKYTHDNDLLGSVYVTANKNNSSNTKTDNGQTQ